MDLINKKIAFLGDSITEGVGASSPEFNYVSLFRSEYPNTVVYNYGVGGTRIARKTCPSQYTVYDWDFYARVDVMPKDIDVIVVLGGVNDFSHGDAVLGKSNDRTLYTFYGALNLLIKKLKKKYKKTKIIICTPITTSYYNERQNNGLILLDVVNAIRERTRALKVDLCDMFEEPSLSLIKNKDNIDSYTDGIHPNDLGHKKLFTGINEYIKKI